MSLRLVSNLDRHSWNDFVVSQAGAGICQSYEWGQLKRAQGWEPHYIAVADGTAWVGATLVLSKSLPGGAGALLYSPCGPLSNDDWNRVLPAMLEGVSTV